MANELCKMLGIEFPILLGGMLFIGRAPLVAAVSEAGGLGILGAGRMTPEQLRESLAEIRRRTPKPFGINLPLRMPHLELLAQVAVEEAVPVVSTSAGSPALYTEQLKKGGVKVIHVAATVGQALKAQQAGVDAVVAEGCESGGFQGNAKVTTLALVPQVVDAVNIPVIAAGGIVDGRGLAASLALGAKGVQMGTRFLATTECGVPADYKLSILMAGDTDTWVVENQSGAGRRILKKELVQNAGLALQDPQSTLPASLDFGESGEEAMRERKHIQGYSAGQGAGMVREILPAGEIVRQMMSTALGVAQNLSAGLT